VSDPQWAVAHALTYGAEAEVVEPEEVRALVRDAVRPLVG
jgi:predicted DNA-binding transcriptional regulator YafY